MGGMEYCIVQWENGSYSKRSRQQIKHGNIKIGEKVKCQWKKTSAMGTIIRYGSKEDMDSYLEGFLQTKQDSRIRKRTNPQTKKQTERIKTIKNNRAQKEAEEFQAQLHQPYESCSQPIGLETPSTDEESDLQISQRIRRIEENMIQRSEVEQSLACPAENIQPSVSSVIGSAYSSIGLGSETERNIQVSSAVTPNENSFNLAGYLPITNTGQTYNGYQFTSPPMQPPQVHPRNQDLYQRSPLTTMPLNHMQSPDRLGWSLNYTQYLKLTATIDMLTEKVFNLEKTVQELTNERSSQGTTTSSQLDLVEISKGSGIHIGRNAAKTLQLLSKNHSWKYCFRKLLQTVFDVEYLADHSAKGKKGSAFVAVDPNKLGACKGLQLSVYC